FPLFSGFVTKSMILTAVGGEGYWVIWTVLLFASAGVLDHSGIKVPFFTFFFHDAGHRVKEAPWNMLLAMGITAFLCIGIGVYPEPLYAILPYPVDYAPYTAAHVITQLQLLMFAALAFAVLMRKGWYPEEIPSTNLDTDWLYRRLLPRVTRSLLNGMWAIDRGARAGAMAVVNGVVERMAKSHGPEGLMSRNISTGAMVSWVSLFLAIYLFLSFY
ncbi:MAG: Na(+)/H(+) antiporter subunit D, partial [Spongiibacter sp.]